MFGKRAGYRYCYLLTGLTTCGVLLFSQPQAEAQHFPGTMAWKKYRKEVSLGAGASNFLGELGGRNRIGSDFIYDVELPLTKFAAHASFTYYLQQRLPLKTSFYYGKLAGDDKLTSEPFRHNRNLHFKSILLELSTQVHYYFYFKDQNGHRYNIKGAKGMQGYMLGSYLFAGIGGLYFNPKAQFGGAWVPLQPLGTEGQGLEPGRPRYSRITMVIPSGIGFRYGFHTQWSVNLELGWRKTFSDYIDDVSTVYYDQQALAQAHGPAGAYLADPSLGLQTNPDIGVTDPGQQRGDPTDKDAYLLVMLSVNYKIKARERKFHKRVRRRNDIPSF